MNFHDSGILREGLKKKGFSISSSAAEADIIIFNTCSVREHAEQKVFSDIGRVKGKTVVLAGCLATQVVKGGRKGKKTAPRLDFYFTPAELNSIPDILAGGAGTRNGLPQPGSKNPDDASFNRDISEKTGTIKISEGCGNFCSYCIVPYVRGTEKPVLFDEIINSAKKIVKEGINDILLLGQNVNSYHSPDDPGKDFSYLLKSLSEIKGIKKIGFISPHPRDFNDKVIGLIAGNDKISKSIHLPLQSGSDKILSSMKRGYTSKDYIALAERLRKACPDITLSTDIIVGFPGETDEDFNMTLSLLEKIGFNSIFGFKYSVRPFTEASNFPDDVPLEKKKERLQVLFEKQNMIVNKNRI